MMHCIAPMAEGGSFQNRFVVFSRPNLINKDKKSSSLSWWRHEELDQYSKVGTVESLVSHGYKFSSSLRMNDANVKAGHKFKLRAMLQWHVNENDAQINVVDTILQLMSDWWADKHVCVNVMHLYLPND